MADDCCGEFDLPWLRIQLTEPITVESPYVTVDERLLRGRQARLIFAMMVVERSRLINRDELAEALWPGGLPPTWRAGLRGVVSNVRSFLVAAGLSEDSACSGRHGFYRLNLPTEVVIDVEHARGAVEAADQMLRAGDVAWAVRLAEYARVVVERPFLPDARGEWVDGVRNGLKKVRLWALCLLSEGHAERGQYQLAIRAAEDALMLEPFRERTHQLLMRIHAAAGNPAEALRTYDRCRRLLAKELGVHPTAETTALHLALLRPQNR